MGTKTGHRRSAGQRWLKTPRRRAVRPEKRRYVYGPVLSRRLGRSLGIDPVRYKVCTYDCVYCQLGPTTDKVIDRAVYAPVSDILAQVKEKLKEKDRPDIISIAGSGEPTLHSGVGEIIRGVKAMTDIPVGVLTNGSLLFKPEVCQALMGADLVMPSLDAGDDRLFQAVNRPHPDLSFDQMVQGLEAFTQNFPKSVWLEVLLLEGMSDEEADVKKIADLVARINPERIQLNTAVRPPAEGYARQVPDQRLRALAKMFTCQVDIIAKREGGPMSTPIKTGDSEILALLSRRPCTLSDVAGGLGIHITEAIKHLNYLRNKNKISLVGAEGSHYYTASTDTYVETE